MIYPRRKKMKRRKTSYPAKRNHPLKKVSEGHKRNRTTWTDPTVPINKISRQGKTKSNKNQMKKNSCWWFG